MAVLTANNNATAATKNSYFTMKAKETLTVLAHNANDLAQDLEWLARLMQVRLQLYSGADCEYEDIFQVHPPEADGYSVYHAFIRHYEFHFKERLALLLALSPHIYPALLSSFFEKLEAIESVPPGIHHNHLPTGETLAFMLSGEDLEARLMLHFLFDSDHVFVRHQVLRLVSVNERWPRFSGLLQLSDDYVEYFTTGRRSLPDFSPDFPARHITTGLTWDDLVLPHDTLNQLEEIRLWIQHGDTLLQDWGLHKKIRPGHRALFYGPPGTGKSVTACLLGKSCDKPVFKIDLSQMVSKYIGETNKNLAKVFDKAEKRDWLLFFDEADALFSKRTKVEDARDRHANQEVAYLLQRLEHHDGIVILASNLKEHIDDAFARRFESVIYFPMPQPPERQQLWEKGFSKVSTLAEDICLRTLSEKHQMSGGAIINVVRYASLMALKRNSQTITLKDVKEGIKKEFRKEGKTVVY
ncbi:MAG: ATP-binding protein [Bacteroidota bacterium]